MKGGVGLVPSMCGRHLHLCRVHAEGYWVCSTCQAEPGAAGKK